MSDVFDEVEESLRAERYRSVFARSWPWLLGLLVLAVVAVAIWYGLRSRGEQAGYRASIEYQAGIDALGRNDRAAADAAFVRAADAGSRGYRALALMQRGAIKLADDQTPGAIAFFDQAAEAAPSPVIGDAATLQAAFAAMDAAPLPEIERRLSPLTAEGRPYRLLAREGLALARAASGQTAQARREFVVLSLSEAAPDSLRARAQANIQLIDAGLATQLRPLAQAAIALPEPVEVRPLPELPQVNAPLAAQPGPAAPAGAP